MGGTASMLRNRCVRGLLKTRGRQREGRDILMGPNSSDPDKRFCCNTAFSARWNQSPPQSGFLPLWIDVLVVI